MQGRLFGRTGLPKRAEKKRKPVFGGTRALADPTESPRAPEQIVFGWRRLPSSGLVLRRREAASKDESRSSKSPSWLDHHPSRRPLRGLLRMRAPESNQTQFVLGWALGAALLMAGCAAPTVQPGQSPKAGLASIDGANVSLASFQNSAFPYHGLIPNYQETGKSRPFLDVDDNGRLGHSSPRGGIHWEDQTYSDRSVLLAAPKSFDPARPGVIIVFFHGNNATLSRDVIARQQIVRQLSDSGLNAVLVAPQLAVDAQDSSAGRFWSAGGFAAFLDEAQSKLGELYPNARGAFRRMPVIIVAYSGGYLPAAYSLAVGGDQGRVRGLVLLDALYGERDKFVSWAEGPGRRAFFVSAYSTSSQAGNDAVRSELEAAGVPVVSSLPAELSPGVVAFVDAGSVDHNDFVTSAWGGAPLRDILARIGG
jgi:hypothetical protein